MGPDTINNAALKKGGLPIARSISILFNLMVEDAWTPEEWNGEHVALTHKGKSKYSLDNYRGIAVSSCVGKVLTRLLTNRLNETAEQQQWLPEAQAAFRKNRCVEDHIFTVRTIMEKSKKEKFPLYAAFLDLRKAYDSVNREMLWDKLESLGLDSRSIGILKSLYRNNTRQIKIGMDTTKLLRCTRGVRQGCPLWPTLFTQDLPDTLSQNTQGVPLGGTRVNIVCYAIGVVRVPPRKDILEEDRKKYIQQLYRRHNRIKGITFIDIQDTMKAGEYILLGCGTS